MGGGGVWVGVVCVFMWWRGGVCFLACSSTPSQSSGEVNGLVLLTL